MEVDGVAAARDERDETADLRNDASAPTARALFVGFFTVGIYGFGGVLPWARRMIVDQRRWMSAADFTDLLALCQFLPGPNVINVAVALGARYRGLRGSLAAFAGLMAAPMVIIILLGLVYARYSKVAWVEDMFAGLAAAASGLVLATALRIAAPLRQTPTAVLIAAATFVAVSVLHVPLVPTMLVMGPLGVVSAARRVR